MSTKIRSAARGKQLSHENYCDALYRVESELQLKVHREAGILIRVLRFEETLALYMARPEWTNRFDEKRDDVRGVFCSCWATEQSLAQARFFYNVHSLKLHRLSGYRLKSRAFAADFREAVADTITTWPNISINYGPLTLMQGHESFTHDNLATKISARVISLLDIVPVIDGLLEDGKNPDRS